MTDHHGPLGAPGPIRRAPRWKAPLIGIGAALAVAAVVVAVLFGAGVLTRNSASPVPQVTVTESVTASPAVSRPAPTSAPTATAPAPAPAHPFRAAKAKVEDLGFTPYANSSVHWNNSWTLNVILGTATGSTDGYNNWAFFFVNGNYIGTDTKVQSAGISLAWQDSDTVALSYILYHPSDLMCCPTAGTATVRYHWTGSHLVALDPIPGAGDNSDPTRM